MMVILRNQRELERQHILESGFEVIWSFHPLGENRLTSRPLSSIYMIEHGVWPPIVD